MTFYLQSQNGLMSSGQPWSIRIVTSGSITEAAANQAWANAWEAFWSTTAVAALFSTSLKVTSFATSTASPTFKQTTVTRLPVNISAGSATTQELPDYAALVWTLRTAFATHYGRGRVFLPAPVAAALAVGSGGHLASANATTIGNGLAAVATSLAGAGLTPVLVTRKTNVSGRPPYSTANVTTRDLGNLLHVQRRRGDKIVATRVPA